MILRRSTTRLALLVFIFVGLASAVSPLRADGRGDAKARVNFGVQVAQKGLWREAIFQWEKAVELDPTYASAYNNLGVAYEIQGDMVKAKQAYEKAMALAPKDPQIKQNYELFKEINDRTSAANEKP